MITKKQLKIFEAFAKKPFAEFTRKQIKEESKEKSNNILALTINKLKQEKIILEKIVGKSGLLRLNFENELTYLYIALANSRRIEKVVKVCLEIINEDLQRQTKFYSTVIFGSYSINEHKDDSDLDIAVFIEKQEDKKIVEATLNSSKLKSVLNLDTHVITKDEMIEMLINNEENLGKQIAEKHLAVYNHKIFYDIINEGMKRGFKL